MKGRELARRTDGVALQVNRLHDELAALDRRAFTTAVKIGGLLELKRQSLGHGQWETWCERYLSFSSRTAGNYRKLWRYRGQLKTENVSELSEAYQFIRALPRPGTENVPAVRPRGTVAPEARLLAEIRAERLTLGHRLGLAVRIVFAR